MEIFLQVMLSIATLVLLVLVLLDVYYRRQLARWIIAPEAVELPEGIGSWNTIFAKIHRAWRRGEKSKHRLSAALNRFRLASSALPDGVVLLDDNHRIEWFNATAQRHFGLDTERDFGTVVTHLIRQPEFVDYLKQKDTDHAVIVRSVQSLEQLLSLMLIPFADKGKMLISRDVTQAEQLEANRRQFIADVSHELRTPLTVVLGFLELVGDVNNRGQLDLLTVFRYNELMLGHARRMTHLVDDLLMLSGLEARNSVANEGIVDVDILARDLFEEAQALSAGHHVITIEAEPLKIRGSTEELRSAFSNLISNAVRYTPYCEGERVSGKITIQWRLIEGAPRFSVIDTGMGVSVEHVPRLTERFYRVDRSRSSETGGTGLGLAIVKRVVAHHQATLEIHSESGKGSTFSIIFPKQRLVL